jgi:tetrahydromethanopterin S-methyltransferase subunit C
LLGFLFLGYIEALCVCVCGLFNVRKVTSRGCGWSASGVGAI